MALLLLVGAIAAEPFAPFARAANASRADLKALVDCKDEHSACADWASKGECEANAGFMLSSCRLSCGRCELHGMDETRAQELCRYMARNAQGACERAPKGATAASCEPQSQMMMLGACEATRDLLHFSLSMHGVSAVVKARRYPIRPDRPYHKRAPTCCPQDLCVLGGCAATPAAPRSPSKSPPPPSKSPPPRVAEVTLRGGARMPRVGVGTWMMTGSSPLAAPDDRAPLTPARLRRPRRVQCGARGTQGGTAPHRHVGEL